MLSVLVGHITVIQTVQDAGKTQPSTRLCTGVHGTQDIPTHFSPHTLFLCALLGFLAHDSVFLTPWKAFHHMGKGLGTGNATPGRCFRDGALTDRHIALAQSPQDLQSEVNVLWPLLFVFWCWL